MRGFLLIEGLVAAALTLLVTSAIAGVYMSTSQVHEGEIIDAALLSSAEAGLSIARSIRDSDSENFPTGTFGVATTSGAWAFSGGSDTYQGVTRSIAISAVTEDVFRVVSSVSHSDGRSKELVSYLSRWREAVPDIISLVLNTSGANIAGSKDKELQGIVIENTGNADAVIETVTLSWDNNRRLEEVVVDGVAVWTFNGVGSPNGKQDSGAEIDIEDITILGEGSVSFDQFLFNGDMTGVTFSLSVRLSDGSNVSFSSFSP